MHPPCLACLLPAREQPQHPWGHDPLVPLPGDSNVHTPHPRSSMAEHQTARQTSKVSCHQSWWWDPDPGLTLGRWVGVSMMCRQVRPTATAIPITIRTMKPSKYSVCSNGRKKGGGGCGKEVWCDAEGYAAGDPLVYCAACCPCASMTHHHTTLNSTRPQHSPVAGRWRRTLYSSWCPPVARTCQSRGWERRRTGPAGGAAGRKGGMGGWSGQRMGDGWVCNLCRQRGTGSPSHQGWPSPSTQPRTRFPNRNQSGFQRNH